jgi:RHH-type transcriptional regulator, rel operon repressor / antitoxin RelB
MSIPSPTISIRLPKASRLNLDRAAKLTRRSRSFLMQEALERHLAEIIGEQSTGAKTPALANLLSLAGAGKGKIKPHTAKQVDDHIRWLRDNG